MYKTIPRCCTWFLFPVSTSNSTVPTPQWFWKHVGMLQVLTVSICIVNLPILRAENCKRQIQKFSWFFFTLNMVSHHMWHPKPHFSSNSSFLSLDFFPFFWNSHWSSFQSWWCWGLHSSFWNPFWTSRWNFLDFFRLWILLRCGSKSSFQTHLSFFFLQFSWFCFRFSRVTSGPEEIFDSFGKTPPCHYSNLPDNRQKNHSSSHHHCVDHHKEV